MKKRRKRTVRTGWGCLMMACCFMLFCGCGGKAPSLVIEDGTAAGSHSQDAGPGNGSDAGLQGEEDSGTKDGGSGKPKDREAQDAEDGLPVEQIYVQVSGAVNHPGVYQLPADSRVFMAVEMAGGLSPQADEGSLNQAETLMDGQQIYVYAQGERDVAEAARETAQETDGRVNLNTATVQELMTLPGIGQSKADSIISYRESNGSFGAVEDLMKIEGIKEGVFSKIKDRVKI